MKEEWSFGTRQWGSRLESKGLWREELGRGEAQRLRGGLLRGLTLLQPQILVGQIFTQQPRLLSKEEGGGRPVAGGPFRLLPSPHKRQLGESEPNRSPQHPLQPRLSLTPPCTRSWGHLCPPPHPKLATGRRNGLGGIYPQIVRLPSFWGSSGVSNLTKCPFPNRLFRLAIPAIPWGLGREGGLRSQDLVGEGILKDGVQLSRARGWKRG